MNTSANEHLPAAGRRGHSKKNNMKNILFILLGIIIFGACQQEEGYPKELEAQKTLLKEKKKEMREMNKLIAKLEADIEKVEPSKEKPRKKVTAIEVKREDFERFVDIQATVEAEDMVAASSEMGGRVIRMKLEEGDYVKKGSLVATIDMESVDKQIAEIEKSLELAKEVFERQDRLWKQNIGSEIQYLQAKNNKERLEKSLETVRFQQTKANVYAPISGVVDMVMVNAGEMTSPGMPIVQLLDLRKVKVVANLPETYLGTIDKGEKVTIKFPALDMEKQGRVSLIGRSINPANRTFKVEVEMRNSDKLLKPNLLASMMIRDFSADNAITLPLELVQQEVSGKNYIYVVTDGENGKIAKKTYVKTGEAYDGNIIIKEGLTGDEQVVMDGARGLTDGALIELSK